MADKKQPSQAQYHKQKAEKAKEQARQEAFFLKYLHTQKANTNKNITVLLLKLALGKLNVVLLKQLI